MLGFK